MARLRTIYGDDLTVTALLQISEKEFLSRRGIGKLYVDRLRKLQRLLSEQICTESTKQVLSCAPNADIRNVPAKYAALYEKLKEFFPDLNTYADLCSISPSDFARFFGVGKRKVESLIQWQGQILSGVQVDQFDEAMVKQLDSYKLSSFFLSDAEQKLLTKHLRRGFSYEVLTPAYIMTLNAEDVISMDGYGKKSAKALQSLQFKIIEGLDSKSSQGILIPLRFGESLSLNELSPLIAEDLARFFDTLSGEEATIWSSRLGYLTEQLTLQELGDQFGVTRERIRQRAENMNESLLRGIRVCPQVLSEKLEGITRSDLLNQMHELRQVIHSDNALMRLLALIANVDSKELLQRFSPTVKMSALGDFFYLHSYPVSRAKLVSALQDELGGTEEETDIYLTTMNEVGLVQVSGDHVFPVGVGKDMAISHILAGYPGGLGWKEIAERVNNSCISRKTLSLERPDGTLNTSSYIFQSGHHTYSHVRYLGIGKSGITTILMDVKAALEKSPHKSIHLMTEYYAKLTEPAHDYYIIRYAVRNYGASCGLFFNGRSQADTVSMHPDVKAISQKEAIRRLFNESTAPLSLQQIALHIKSQAENHARFYISELMTAGEIVSIETNQFQSRKSAFREIDIEGVKEVITSLLKADNRTHHLSTIASQLNRMKGYDYSIRFWRAFIASYAGETGWFVKGMLVSAKEIEINGLSELVREASGYSQEDTIAWIQQRVCASRDIIKRAIYNVRDVQRNTPEMGIEEKGIASDIMEELFSL
ncbi:MAG: hypothetical protein JXR40_08715 [Pontiellaceae bacterium]|nr:hypothetical protein [Pontiellaceae bacterium]